MPAALSSKSDLQVPAPPSQSLGLWIGCAVMNPKSAQAIASVRTSMPACAAPTLRLPHGVQFYPRCCQRHAAASQMPQPVLVARRPTLVWPHRTLCRC